ncbi:hypothetical protein TIFTF001_000942 [Ficus carica]|uniref:Uncharacterized protein n=1 Tax=Ficus carica TaxID=3494 RepID=A0AA87ZJN1_FICCA|nr:hypothetical protein TIFTF001_000942 [Ficus carica]
MHLKHHVLLVRRKDGWTKNISTLSLLDHLKDLWPAKFQPSISLKSGLVGSFPVTNSSKITPKLEMSPLVVDLALWNESMVEKIIPRF